jgi:hypothetical protein
MKQNREYLYMPSVLDGVIIGGAGGAIAGITVYLA